MAIGIEGTLRVSDCWETWIGADAKTEDKQNKFLNVDPNQNQKVTSKICLACLILL